MIFRLILLFLIIWFLIWIIKKQFSSGNKTEDKAQSTTTEDMIACHHCSTHTPKSLGVEIEGHFYCCREHAEIEKDEQ